MHRLRFRDRADAGRKLAAELRARKLGLAGWGPAVWEKIRLCWRWRAAACR